VPSISEAELQDATLELAHVLGWHVLHVRAARTEKGWRVPVQADGSGWPDIFGVRQDRAIAAELKSARGKLAPEQSAWLALLADAGIECHLWRPADWLSGEIEAALR
jgi:hypothetical protein